MQDAAPPKLTFDPDEPIDWTPEWHRDVTLVPWAENEPNGYKRAAGVFDRSGAHIAASHAWRYAGEPMTVVPDYDGARSEQRLAGRWLFGGVFYPHFGHFLAETTSRLWAIDRIGAIDGIVFYPKKRLTHEFRLMRQHVPFFARLGLGDLALRAVQVPVQIDEIAFPEPAFGIGEMSAGRPEYRRFMRDRLGQDIAPDGAEDIYISRSGLSSRRGRVVMETRIEDLMAAAGYRVYHPQDHGIDAQIAQYKAARRIVALDGSALHLAAMVVDPVTRVAIINRGPSMNIEDYLLQFRRFAGVEPVRVEAIKGCWVPSGGRFVKREAQAHVDFPTVGAALAKADFIPDDSAWTDPPQEELDAHVDALAQALGAPLSYWDLTR
ncbi:glycosyltransferase 61 family protein [Boseongicola sp. H5]|uniref:glycosyltransferase family 61 protein n=1 Tax=Boseongicola sp. H5 TaxID=2763261 RepID=UPI001D0AA1F9|nr:glycosyltransferase 61 family protein [Boseongicola sp. H5]